MLGATCHYWPTSDKLAALLVRAVFSVWVLLGIPLAVGVVGLFTVVKRFTARRLSSSDRKKGFMGSKNNNIDLGRTRNFLYKSFFHTTPLPLVLPNVGNTCYLASMVQVLFAAFVNSDRKLFDTTPPDSEVGEALFSLCNSSTGSETQLQKWKAFVDAFYEACDIFVKGAQNDSGLAFSELAGVIWQVPPSLIAVTLETSSNLDGVCTCNAPSRAATTSTSISLAANDSPPINIAEKIINSYNFEIECINNCGVIKYTGEYTCLPKILFVKTSSSADIINAAQTFSLQFRHGRQKYKLIGAALHSGFSVNSGHYQAVVALDGQWFECNDGAYDPIRTPMSMFNGDTRVQLMVFKAFE